ncbi:hypothetical protein ACNKHL_12875 [Shigella flexneri]
MPLHISLREDLDKGTPTCHELSGEPIYRYLPPAGSTALQLSSTAG